MFFIFKKIRLIIKKFKIFLLKLFKYGGSAILATGVTLFFTTILSISENLIQKSSEIELAKIDLKNQSISFEKEYKLKVLSKFVESYESYYKEYFLNKLKYIDLILEGNKLNENDIINLNKVFNEGSLEKSYLIRITIFLSIAREDPNIKKSNKRFYSFWDHWGQENYKSMPAFDRHILYIEKFNEYLLKWNIDKDFTMFEDLKPGTEKERFEYWIRKVKLDSETLKMNILDVENQLLNEGQ